MAYIIRVIYKDMEEELVTIWSPVIDTEVDILMKNNPEIELYEIMNDAPTEEECRYIYENMRRTTYTLPRQFRRNRRRRV